MKRLFLGAVVSIVCFLALCPAVGAECLSGTSTAMLEAEGPFAGFYKYTVVVNWSTDFGLSHFTLNPGWTCGPYACENGAFIGFTTIFPSPTGTSDGEPAPCTVEYGAELNCNGDPTAPPGYHDVPVLKWDALDGSCEPGHTGTATLFFYADSPPSPVNISCAIVKAGQTICEGMITGDFPMPCPIPVDPMAWGGIKALYR